MKIVESVLVPPEVVSVRRITIEIPDDLARLVANALDTMIDWYASGCESELVDLHEAFGGYR